MSEDITGCPNPACSKWGRCFVPNSCWKSSVSGGTDRDKVFSKHETDTPRTDAVFMETWSGKTRNNVVDADFARQLERELKQSLTPKITTRCPSCGGETLFIGSGGHLTCSVIGCREPSVERCVAELYNERSQIERELNQTREKLLEAIRRGFHEQATENP